MTMHLMHPCFTTTGKKKSKQKFRSSEAAQRSREHNESWNDLKKRWNAPDKKTKQDFVPLKYSPNIPKDRDPRALGKSLGSGPDNAFKTPDKIYTGTKILGIGTMHKSNAVPIFSDEEAKDIATMRR